MSVGLLDIEPSATEIVSVNGASVSVGGIESKGVLQLLKRFPELALLLLGTAPSLDRLLDMGGDVTAAIIAAGCGYLGDEKAEAKAASLSLDAQMDLLTAILRLTLPNGVGPFVAKLGALAAVVGTEGAAADGGPIKVRAKKSPKPSSGPSREEATEPMQPGA